MNLQELETAFSQIDLSKFNNTRLDKCTLILDANKFVEVNLLTLKNGSKNRAVIEIFQAENNQILINWNTYLVGNVQVKDTATFKHVDFSVLESEKIKEITVLQTDKFEKTDTLKIFSITSDTLIYKNKDYIKAAFRCENLSYQNAPYNITIFVRDTVNSMTSQNIIINYKF